MSDELFCNVNGHVQSCTEVPFSSADDAFRLRYGLYETCRYEGGKLEYAALHWERLMHGLTALGFTIPAHFSEQYFTGQINELVVKNRCSGPVRIRLQVFTEEVSAPYRPQFLIESFPLERAVGSWLQEGIRIGVLDSFRKEISAAANCKISHNRHFIPARQIMEQQGLDDVLLYNTEGRICESSMANLFWVKDGMVCTTPLSEGCLAGTLRTVIVNCLRENQVPFKEQPCPLPELQEADEIFLSNSIRKIRWVREMGERQYSCELTKKIDELLIKPKGL